MFLSQTIEPQAQESQRTEFHHSRLYSYIMGRKRGRQLTLRQVYWLN